MIRALTGVAVCMLAMTAAMADPPPAANPLAVPPSPFSDSHGVYDSGSRCWVWDAERTVPMTNAADVLFRVEGRCDDTPLNGPAKVTWVARAHDGEVWEGNFTAGKFTGSANLTSEAGSWKGGYVDGLRDGPSVMHYKDGGLTEENFAGLREGHHRQIYTDGTRTDGQYEKGQPAGHWVKILRDGSRELSDLGAAPRGFDEPLIYVTPDGRTLPGVFHLAHVDLAASPRLAYPPIAVRLGEQGEVSVSCRVMTDGTVQDVRLIRSSGFQRLDDTMMTFMAGVHYKPATLAGVPMDSYVVLTQNFHLNGPR